eukprot:CAMPEP_0206459226 /NCGR_PEP_ID=MMETSP0324_2-20121206/24053_1 /ASSEMBLY_ACC=CAM_ASM_000836 /TAXON_ID=2866 /ORGANISM="Crypthecodinium cohnii, Strain Seligo" /LENGTH=643 /DNA_ID=CAMNT_0053930743 /DNA_START=62 /DNA_END=1993 /DNA_ORIENTATION=+
MNDSRRRAQSAISLCAMLSMPILKFAAGADNKVVMLDMYRAMAKSDIGQYPLENDNLASLAGVLKYLANVVREEGQDANREGRSKGIDTVIRTRVKVKNPSFDLDNAAQYKRLHTDFGPYAVFDYGQSVNEELDVVYSHEAGNWVGIQAAPDWGSLFEKREPSFWFSLGGFCPNLPWKPMPLKDKSGAVLYSTPRCDKANKKDLCEAKGTTDKPDAKCLKDASEKPILSGLCADGADSDNETPEKDPTGEATCAYTYGKPVSVDLDDLVEIQKQECGGGRPCKDWADFRANCDDPNLKRVFSKDGTIVSAVSPVDGKPFCVEYSIHPDCVESCSGKCPYLDSREDVEYEIGLPYWKGRCSDKSNQKRVEKLGFALGLAKAEEAHEIVHEDVLKAATTCLVEGSNICTPNIFDDKNSVGGPYCSRAYSGVCWLCYIPGSVNLPSDAAEYGVCPFDILSHPDYKDAPSPVCSSKKASEGCCLYTNTCDGTDDPAEASLDADGLALMQKKCFTEKSSTPMLTFMNRYVASKNPAWMVESKDKQAIDKAYGFWRNSFLTIDFADFSEAAEGLAIEYKVTSTSKPETTTTTVEPGKPGGAQPWVVAVILIGVIVLATACYFFVVFSKRQQVTLPPPEQDVLELRAGAV